MVLTEIEEAVLPEAEGEVQGEWVEVSGRGWR